MTLAGVWGYDAFTGWLLVVGGAAALGAVGQMLVAARKPDAEEQVEVRPQRDAL